MTSSTDCTTRWRFWTTTARSETVKTSKRTRPSRKRSPPRPAGIEAVLRSVAEAARALGARWYLFGAQAVALHGVPRTTQDVDVTLIVDAPGTRVVAALKKVGIVSLIKDDAFIAATRVIPSRHAATGWKVDVVLGGPGLEEHIARRALKARLGTVTVPLIRAEHLVALKVLAGRPQDLVDVGRMIAVKGKTLDLDEPRALLRALEVELGESGLVARLDAIAASG